MKKGDTHRDRTFLLYIDVNYLSPGTTRILFTMLYNVFSQNIAMGGKNFVLAKNLYSRC